MEEKDLLQEEVAPKDQLVEIFFPGRWRNVPKKARRREIFEGTGDPGRQP